MTKRHTSQSVNNASKAKTTYVILEHQYVGPQVHCLAPRSCGFRPKVVRPVATPEKTQMDQKPATRNLPLSKNVQLSIRASESEKTTHPRERRRRPPEATSFCGVHTTNLAANSFLCGTDTLN